LKKKYGKNSLRVVVDDTVRILRGEYKGVDGKVTKVSTEKNGVAIEGIKKEKLKGEKVDVFIHTSNVIITNVNDEDHWRKTRIAGKKPKKTPKETKPEKIKETQVGQPKETKPTKVETTDDKTKDDKPPKPKVSKPKPKKKEDEV